MATSLSDAAYRWAAVLAVLAAAGGWGAFFLTSEHTAALAQAQVREIRDLRQARAELETVVLAERAKAADLKSLETELQTARQGLERAKEVQDKTREAQEKAKAALTTTQNELASRRTELAALAAQAARTREQQAKAEQAAAEQTASIKKAAPRKERWTRRHKRGKRFAKNG